MAVSINTIVGVCDNNITLQLKRGDKVYFYTIDRTPSDLKPEQVLHELVQLRALVDYFIEGVKEQPAFADLCEANELDY
jgi:hypothetical protein